MAARDVFISHSSGDAESARELRAVLEGAGYSCWMAPDDIVGTETWTEQILAAIADSKVMVVLVSAAANASPHVSREVNLALGRKRAVLPIRIEPVAPEGPLEYLLSLVQRLDAFPPPMSSHGPRILRRVESIVQRPQTTPLPTPDTGPMEAPRSDAAGNAPPRSDGGGAGAGRPAPQDGSTAAPEQRRSSSDLGPGSVVGAFTIESQLGEGGMATVYRARQDEPRRLVALKVIRADHTANETYRRRFLEEKDTLAALEHPSIVPIYAAGESDGVLFIAMRLVDGPDLQARIKTRGHLGLRETVQVLGPIADAIDYAHAMGVVHRDLKPSNIILDRDGRPYLTDFGLGKRLVVIALVTLALFGGSLPSTGGPGPDGPIRTATPSNIVVVPDDPRAKVPGSLLYVKDGNVWVQSGDKVDSQLSMPGMAIGTLDYMAPELFKGNADPKLAPSIDLYALGCVAFQCLTGQAPFVRSSATELMYAHANEPPPTVTALRPETSPSIDSIFAKVLAKDPAARFGSAREFIANLASVAEEPAQVPAPAATPTQTPAPTQTPSPTATPSPASTPVPPPPPVRLPPSSTAGAQPRSWFASNAPLVLAGGAVALVLVFVLGAGLVFPPDPTPTPRALPTDTAQETAEPTPEVTIEPPETPATGDFPNDLEAELLAMQPAGVVDTSTCIRDENKYADALAMVYCDAPGGATGSVFFALYDSPESLTASYDGIVENAGIEAGSGPGCFELDQSNRTWVYTGQTTDQGFLACYPRTSGDVDGIQYIWTMDAHDVLGLWLSPSYDDGLAFFKDWAAAIEH